MMKNWSDWISAFVKGPGQSELIESFELDSAQDTLPHP